MSSKALTADFSTVLPGHNAIHNRLVNWARWVTVHPTSFTQPMFAGYTTSRKWEANPHISTPVDKLDAAVIEHAVAALPHHHRYVVRWLYVHRNTVSVTKMRKALGVTAMTASDLGHRARQMLVNKGL